MSAQDWTSILGPLQSLYHDAGIHEIMVDAPDNVYVERKGQLESSSVRFASVDELLYVIEAICHMGGVAINAQHPTADVRLPDGSRMTAVLPPTAINGPCCIIRKRVNNSMTWDRLVDYGALTREAVALLQHAIHDHKSILVVGGTGSGTTTLMNVLAATIPATQRVVAVEQRHELQFAHPRSLFLEASGAASVEFGDLLQTASTLRADWLVLSALRGAEAMPALQLLSMGHSGLLSIHAPSAEDALQRLEGMCLMAHLRWGLGDIRAMIANAISLIVVHQRLANGQRRIIQIVECTGISNDRMVLNPLMRYNPDTDRLEATELRPSWTPKP